MIAAAARATLEPLVLRVVDAVHLLAASAWLGGLTGLLVLLVPRGDAARPADVVEAAQPVVSVAAPVQEAPPPHDDASYSPAGMERDDEPPLDEDYYEPELDPMGYSYLDELASEAPHCEEFIRVASEHVRHFRLDALKAMLRHGLERTAPHDPE